MIKQLRFNEIRNLFKEKGLLVFSPLDIQRYFKVFPNTASLFLNRNVKSGNLQKLRRGVYCFTGENSDSLVVANKIYKPSYVSFEYALMRYNIIPETVYSITSATPRNTNEFTINGVVYAYYHIKPGTFTGYAKQATASDGQEYLLAEPEKAMADYLYFVTLGRKGLNDRLDLKKTDKKKVLAYGKLFKLPKLQQLIKQIYDDQKRHRDIIY